MPAARHFLRIVSCTFLLVSPVFAQTFAAPKNYPPFTDSFRVAVGDFNRDGAADLIGVINLNGGTQIDFYLNTGAGAFGTPSAVPSTSGALQAQVGDGILCSPDLDSDAGALGGSELASFSVRLACEV